MRKRIPHFLESLSFGSSVFLVTDPGVVQAGLVDPIQSLLEDAGYRVSLFYDLVQNPRDIDCVRGAEQFRDVRADVILAVGGGSAMDTGKAIALCGPNGGTPADYADGKRAYADAAPIVCLPTTAGTGSEVTRSAVITETETHRKMTLKDVSLRPTLAVLDPELTYTVPPSVTAATGVDALVHAIEGYTCRVTNPISQALGARAMELIIPSLPEAYLNGRDKEARSSMVEGSLLAGLCFGSADVAAVHCLAEALGGLYDTPHGVANAVFLPHVLRFNAARYEHVHAQLARLMKFSAEKDSDRTAVERLIDGITEWTALLKIPRLRDLAGVRAEDFPRIVDLALQNTSTSSNIRKITEEGYLSILMDAFYQV